MKLLAVKLGSAACCSPITVARTRAASWGSILAAQGTRVTAHRVLAATRVLRRAWSQPRRSSSFSLPRAGVGGCVQLGLFPLGGYVAHDAAQKGEVAHMNRAPRCLRVPDMLL